MNEIGSILGIIFVLMLGACATTNNPPNTPYGGVANPGNVYSEYGVVQSVELVKQAKSGVGLGTIAGAVVGGVVGNQVGAGRGNTAATVLGAAGGAYIGHEMENRQQQNADAYKVTVRMESGAYQSVMYSTNPDFRAGERVRFENGALQRY
ncbi:MAG TPA: glycine zipper 2TM domain-containing protein [Rugosibacter sp.]